MTPTSGAPGRLEPRLEEYWKTWLEETGPLMLEAERDLFLGLEGDTRKEGFAEAFWSSRGLDSLQRWSRNRQEALQLRSQSPERVRVVRLAGKPAQIETYIACQGLRTLEVWRWEPWQLALQGGTVDKAAVMIFVQTTSFDPRSLTPWVPGDLDSLTAVPILAAEPAALLDEIGARECFGGRSVRLERALERAVSEDGLRQRIPWPQPDLFWLERFKATPEFAARAHEDSALEISFPGSFNEYTILQGRLAIEPARLQQLNEGQVFDRVTLTGDVFTDRRLADSFHIVHHVAGALQGSAVELDFFRRLRPGSYSLHLRAADRNGLALFHRRLDIEVPVRDEKAPEPAGHASDLSLLTRAEMVILDTLPSIEILPPAARGSSRVVRAITTGGPIGSVRLSVDGVEILTATEPPFEATVADTGTRQRIEAVAMDPLGRPLARHERWLEPGRRPTYLRFAAAPEDGAVAIDVSLPAGQEIDAIRCLIGGREVALLTEPPWACPVPRRTGGRFQYVTASTTLDNGDVLEDVLFLGERAPEEMEVRLAELYLKVQDARGRPALGLAGTDFRIWEAGEERPLERAESLDDLALDVAVLMDISSSMGRRVQIASQSTQGFFRHVLTEGDQASLLAFNHDLHLIVPFTADQKMLRHGAGGIRAWGSTRLHDAIVFALFQFTGLENRRALIVLSDGADVESDYPFDQVLATARSAGVSVYAVSLGAADERTRADLQQIAVETGGRWFSVDSVNELDTVFERIVQELRSQYLLVYRPRPHGGGSPDLDPVEVEVLRPGLEARDVRGHYAGAGR